MKISVLLLTLLLISQKSFAKNFRCEAVGSDNDGESSAVILIEGSIDEHTGRGIFEYSQLKNVSVIRKFTIPTDAIAGKRCRRHYCWSVQIFDFGILPRYNGDLCHHQVVLAPEDYMKNGDFTAYLEVVCPTDRGAGRLYCSSEP